MRKYILSTLLGVALVASGSLSSAIFAEDEKKGDAAAKTEAKSDAKTDSSKSDVKTETESKSEKPAKPEKKAKEPKPEKKVKEPKPETKAKASDGDGGGAGGIAAHVASFVAGTFVGIPVQIWRKSKAESINATRDLVGDTDKKWLTGAAAILGVPAGVLSGTIQATIYGPLNAYRGTKDEPFSPETFSLGDSK